MFTVTGGMSSLILREIPTRKEAFVLVRAVFTTLRELLRECEGFCRAAGAETVFFGGNADFSEFSVYARLIERSLARDKLPAATAVAVPTDGDAWARLYNARFAAVPAAQSFSETPEGAYFIYDGETRIGLGLVRDDRLSAVAALERGRGSDCVCALAGQIRSDEIKLLVAQENLPAMRLYDRLGFSRGAVKEIWYRSQ